MRDCPSCPAGPIRPFLSRTYRKTRYPRNVGMSVSKASVFHWRRAVWRQRRLRLRASSGRRRQPGRGVLLYVGRVLAAVEDVIGRDVDEGSRAAAAARAPAAALTWRAGHGSRPPAASASACVRSSSGRPTATRAVPRRRASWIRQRASWPVWSATTIGRGPDIADQWAGSSRPSRSPP